MFNPNLYTFRSESLKKELRSSPREELMSARSKQADSDAYAADYLTELERKHEYEIVSLRNKLKAQEDHHESQVDQLKRQITKTREMINNRSQDKSNEAEKLRKECQKRLEVMRSQNTHEVEELTFTLQELKKRAEQESQIMQAKKKEINSAKLNQDEEINKLQDKKLDLTRELDFLKEKIADIHKNEIGRLQDTYQKLKEKHAKEIERIKLNKDAEEKEIDKKLDAKERMLQNLEYEVSHLRREFELRKQETDNDLKGLKESLLESQRRLESHEHEVSRILPARDAAKRETNVLTKSINRLEIDIAKEMNKNKKYRERIARLEKLVYSKGSATSLS